MFRHLAPSGGMLLLAAIWLAMDPRLALAQGQPPGQVQLPRPTPMAPAVALSPELEQILLKWEQASSQTSKFKGDLKRYEYDDTFLEVKAGTGHYWYELPDKGRLDIEAVKEIKPGETKQANGLTYKVVPATHMTWVSNGETIYVVEHGPPTKQYSEVKIPPELRGSNVGKGPLPFLFGMKAADIKTRYRLELGRLHDVRSQIHIVAYPLLEGEQVEYCKAEVMITPTTFLPYAVQLTAPTNTKRTVYTFDKHDPVSMWIPGNNPFNIDGGLLFRLQYKRLESVEQPPQQQATEPKGIMLR